MALIKAFKFPNDTNVYEIEAGGVKDGIFFNDKIGQWEKRTSDAATGDISTELLPGINPLNENAYYSLYKENFQDYDIGKWTLVNNNIFKHPKNYEIWQKFQHSLRNDSYFIGQDDNGNKFVQLTVGEDHAENPGEGRAAIELRRNLGKNAVIQFDFYSTLDLENDPEDKTFDFLDIWLLGDDTRKPDSNDTVAKSEEWYHAWINWNGNSGIFGPNTDIYAAPLYSQQEDEAYYTIEKQQWYTTKISLGVGFIDLKIWQRDTENEFTGGHCRYSNDELTLEKLSIPRYPKFMFGPMQNDIQANETHTIYLSNFEISQSINEDWGLDSFIYNKYKNMWELSYKNSQTIYVPGYTLEGDKYMFFGDDFSDKSMWSIIPYGMNNMTDTDESYVATQYLDDGTPYLKMFIDVTNTQVIPETGRKKNKRFTLRSIYPTTDYFTIEFDYHHFHGAGAADSNSLEICLLNYANKKIRAYLAGGSSNFDVPSTLRALQDEKEESNCIAPPINARVRNKNNQTITLTEGVYHVQLSINDNNLNYTIIDPNGDEYSYNEDYQFAYLTATNKRIQYNGSDIFITKEDAKRKYYKVGEAGGIGQYIFSDAVGGSPAVYFKQESNKYVKLDYTDNLPTPELNNGQLKIYEISDNNMLNISTVYKDNHVSLRELLKRNYITFVYGNQKNENGRFFAGLSNFSAYINTNTVYPIAVGGTGASTLEEAQKNLHILDSTGLVKTFENNILSIKPISSVKKIEIGNDPHKFTLDLLQDFFKLSAGPDVNLQGDDTTLTWNNAEILDKNNYSKYITPKAIGATIVKTYSTQINAQNIQQNQDYYSYIITIDNPYDKDVELFLDTSMYSTYENILDAKLKFRHIYNIMVENNTVTLYSTNNDIADLNIMLRWME